MPFQRDLWFNVGPTVDPPLTDGTEHAHVIVHPCNCTVGRADGTLLVSGPLLTELHDWATDDDRRLIPLGIRFSDHLTASRNSALRLYK
jgi:hypothetical protein